MSKPDNDFATSVTKTDEFFEYCKKHGYDGTQVITSLDFDPKKDDFSSEKLGDLGLLDPQFSDKMPPDGSITKAILPFTFSEGSVFSMVIGGPNVTVREHSHTKGFLRVVMFGQYTFTGLPGGDITLKVGDWVYIPKGQKYGYVTGPEGGGGGCCYCTGGGGGQSGGGR